MLKSTKFDSVIAFRALVTMGFTAGDTIRLGSGLLRITISDYNICFIDSMRKNQSFYLSHVQTAPYYIFKMNNFVTWYDAVKSCTDCAILHIQDKWFCYIIWHSLLYVLDTINLIRVLQKYAGSSTKQKQKTVFVPLNPL